MSSIKHHPSRAMLVDFSAGNLGTAESICVSAHLHFCDQCRNELMRLDQVASQLMTEAEPQTYQAKAHRKTQTNTQTNT